MHRCAERACQVRPPFAPIYALPREPAASGPQFIHIYAERCEECVASFGDVVCPIAVRADNALLHEPIGDRDAEAPGQMIVTRARSLQVCAERDCVSETIRAGGAIVVLRARARRPRLRGGKAVAVLALAFPPGLLRAVLSNARSLHWPQRRHGMPVRSPATRRRQKARTTSSHAPDRR